MKKILVIEDDANIRSNIIEVLEAGNFNAIGAENGRVGVRLAQEELPDLILCDVMMPELDGYGVLTRLRQDPVTAVIPFIFLTALAEKADTRKGMDLGADDYVSKPCTPKELLNAIATRLKKQSVITGFYTQALKQVSQQLDESIYYDSLTCLPNRQFLQTRFEQLVNNLESDYCHHNLPLTATKTEPLLSILYLGLDRFNRIVETLGHAGGDLLLKAVAVRLQSCIDGSNTWIRLSTDEFVLVLPRIKQTKEAAQISQKILEALSKPFLLENDYEILITATIGIALYPRDGRQIEKLLQSAGKAMSYAKQQGGNLYKFYQTTFDFDSTERLALETSLSYALERQELQVYYQPQVSLKTGKIVGVEALLRWHHPERGMISPAKFIPIAEETGLIISIGEWVLRTACQQLKRWHDAGVASLRVAVNLSARQFNQTDQHSRLFQILQETDLEPQYLELELTESMLVQNPELGLVRLNAFKTLGVQIALDDFGTGYSSLRYLQIFPFDTLKIDQCFVRELAQNRKTRVITKAIIKIAHELQLKLVAEGVENQEELEFLCQNSCDEVQGYLFSKPLTNKALEKFLLSGKIWKFPMIN